MPSLHFDQPEFLLLGLLAIPLLIIGWRALALADNLRRTVALALRTLLLLALTFMLAGPRMVREHNHLTVIGLLDISGSVQRFGGSDIRLSADDSHESPGTQSSIVNRQSSIIEHLRQWFRRATQLKEPDDRFGLVVFDGKAIAISAPTKTDYVDDNLDVPIAPGTNIADAVRLGLAMFPADTAKRLVLVTDGNETAGNVLEAIKQAGGADFGFSILDFGLPRRDNASKSKIQNPKSKIPVDVLPIAYHVTGDVQVLRVETPPAAQPGQTVTVRIILEATAPTTGSLTLRREGEPVDLNGNRPGAARHVSIPAGQSVHLAQVALGQTPINRFEAIFEADNPADNVLPDNDRAEAFTATPSKGAVLVLDPNAGKRGNTLAQMLNAADLPTIVQLPAQLPDDLLSMQNFDLIVLDNVSAAELSARQQQMLWHYVNDMGGGMIMSGGDNSFGAGGWNGTIVEALLPLELDPSRELRLPTAALVLVLDKSGSMHQGVAGARASQQQVANEGAALAIESLRTDNLVGVIAFDTSAYTIVPLQRNENPKKLAERVRGIQAEGGTNLRPALLMAYDMLKGVQVSKKRVVCLTDGRSSSTSDLENIAQRMAEADIQLSTISVGDDADQEMLQKLAEVGKGEFYEVRDPRRLPRVLVDSVQVINKPLIKEVSFTPRVLPTGSTLTAGMDAAPELNGLVITSPRNDPKITLEMIDPDGEPVLAHWQAGLGRVAAFTSAAPGSGNWAQRWIDWPTAATFWTQLARMTARPAMSQDSELIASIQDDRLQIALELAEPEAADHKSDVDSPLAPGSAGGGPATQPAALSTQHSAPYLQVDGTVYRPDGTTAPVRLRQAAPGRYEATVEANLAGNYIVALNPRQGVRQLAPVIGGANRSTSPEFRRYASNLGLLEEIVQNTNGRRLDIADPQALNLFDRAGMTPSVSSLPVWRMILVWSLALLLLDVACRRIAWDSNLIRGLVSRVMARMTPAHLRGTEAAATLATLRRVSDEMEQRQEAQSAGMEKFQATGRIAPPPDWEERLDASSSPLAPGSGGAGGFGGGRPPTPEPSKVAAALDALLGRSQPTSPQTPEAQPPSAAAPDSQAIGSSAAETTSNLLAARRRARQRLPHDEQDRKT